MQGRIQEGYSVFQLKAWGPDEELPPVNSCVLPWQHGADFSVASGSFIELGAFSRLSNRYHFSCKDTTSSKNRNFCCLSTAFISATLANVYHVIIVKNIMATVVQIAACVHYTIQ